MLRTLPPLFWCSYSKERVNKIKVAYNDALRILFKYPRWESTSYMFVTCNVPTFQALIRNILHKCVCRLSEWKNGIMSLTNLKKSDRRHLFGNAGRNPRMYFHFSLCKGLCACMNVIYCLLCMCVCILGYLDHESVNKVLNQSFYFGVFLPHWQEHVRFTSTPGNSAPGRLALSGQLGDFLGGSGRGGFQCDQLSPPRWISELDPIEFALSHTHLNDRRNPESTQNLNLNPDHEVSAWGPKAPRHRHVDGLNPRESAEWRAAELSCGLWTRFMWVPVKRSQNRTWTWYLGVSSDAKYTDATASRAHAPGFSRNEPLSEMEQKTDTRQANCVLAWAAGMCVYIRDHLSDRPNIQNPMTNQWVINQSVCPNGDRSGFKASRLRWSSYNYSLNVSRRPTRYNIQDQSRTTSPTRDRIWSLSTQLDGRVRLQCPGTRHNFTCGAHRDKNFKKSWAADSTWWAASFFMYLLSLSLQSSNWTEMSTWTQISWWNE